MVRERIADFAITEDCDLIAFGCPKIILKMNASSHGKVFDYNVFKNEKNIDSWDEKLKTLQSLNRDEFLNVCIMAGCEYLKSIDRIGLKVVLNNIKKFKTCEEVIKDLQKN